MAKFKVGDRVRIIGGGVETIASVHPKGQGTGFGPKEVDYYTTRESDGFITDDDISGVANSRTCNSCRSRNAIVAKALNACGTARNASLKQGQTYLDAARPFISQLDKLYDELQELAYDASMGGDSKRLSLLRGACADADRAAEKLRKL